ncbi:hypothetical protein D9M71_461070 [compost metagenome]
MHVRIGVVHHVVEGAVGTDGQGAVEADEHRARRGDRDVGAGIAFRTGADQRHRQRVAVGVEGVCGGVAARVDPRRAVIHPAGFPGDDHHVLRHRRIVHAAHDDVQLRLVGQAGGIGDLVGEELVQGFAGA